MNELITLADMAETEDRVDGEVDTREARFDGEAPVYIQTEEDGAGEGGEPVV